MTTPALLGAGMTRLGRLPEGPAELAEEAARLALADAGIEPSALSMVVSANAMGGVLSAQESIRGQSWLRGLGVGGVAVFNVENGCAAGSSGLNLACKAGVQGGARERGPGAGVGVEKMWTGDRGATLAGIEGCLPADERRPHSRSARGPGELVHGAELDLGGAPDGRARCHAGAVRRRLGDGASPRQHEPGGPAPRGPDCAAGARLAHDRRFHSRD